MFKKWLKQFFAVCICVITILSLTKPAFADETLYHQSDEDDDYTYYIASRKNVKDLFNFSIKDIDNLASWIFEFNTYTVIKKYNQQGNVYKVYFNTPNLQSIVKNQVTSTVDDGYTDNTYKVEDTEWLVAVGKHSTKRENVINKYGFQIPNYTYMGEYPKAVMSAANIVPNPSEGLLKTLWRAIKSFFFGASFIDPPSADNYNTITYLNHGYTDNSEYLIDFFQNYFLPYFVDKIPKTYIDVYKDNTREKEKTGTAYYFQSPYHVLQLSVSDDEYSTATQFIWENSDKNREYIRLDDTYYTPYEKTNDIWQFLSYPEEPNKAFEDYTFELDDDWLYITSLAPFNEWFTQYLKDNPKIAYKAIMTIIKNRFSEQTSVHPLFIKEGSDYYASKSQVLFAENNFYGLSDYVYNDALVEGSTSVLASILLPYYKKYVNANIIKTSYSSKATALYKKGTITYKYNKETKKFEEAEKTTISVNIKNKPDKVLTVQDSYGSTSELTMPYAEIEWLGQRDANGIYKVIISTGKVEERNKQKEDIEIPQNITFEDLLNGIYTVDVYEAYDTTSAYDTYEVKNIGYTNGFIDEGYTFTETQWVRFLNGLKDFNEFEYTKDDFIDPELQSIHISYVEYEKLRDMHNEYIELFKQGAKYKNSNYMEDVVYRQCLIESEGGEGSCWSKKYSDQKTTITVADAYVYSGVWEIIEQAKNARPYSTSISLLTKEETIEILNKLQTYCGPYYSEVVTNLVKIMCSTARWDGNYNLTKEATIDDVRVMPYDVETLLTADKVNYQTTDPRVTMYKEHTIGSLIADLKLKIAFDGFIKPQKTIINLAGRITELSVLMQQLCDFDLLDDIGLSPTNLWTNGYVGLLMGLLALFFIIKTLINIIKLAEKASSQVITGFFVLAIELGFLTCILVNPTKTWNTIKTVDKKIIYAGESVMTFTVPSLNYLYGDTTDMEVMYYLPYLDIWSTYNTGYGILSDKQEINYFGIEPEVQDFEYEKRPQIGGRVIGHWSVLLADSFSYWGKSNSSLYNYVEDGKVYNGVYINPNAYRVVDHFLAPRVSIHPLTWQEAGSPTYNGAAGVSQQIYEQNHQQLRMTVTANENNNGAFQKGMLNLIVKLLNCCLMCFLSLIKMLTFFWQWFVFYIFIFRVVIGIGAEKKSMRDILIETFSPAICLLILGLYIGVIQFIGMSATGVFGIILEIFLFWLTFMMIRWWHNSGTRLFGAQCDYFPKTLYWVYALTNISDRNRRISGRRLAEQSRNNARDVDDELTEEETYELDKRTAHYFEDSGKIKEQYHDPKYKKVLEDWYVFAYNSRNRGRQWTDQEYNAIIAFEADNRFKDIVASGKRKIEASKRNRRPDKISNDRYCSWQEYRSDKLKSGGLSDTEREYLESNPDCCHHIKSQKKKDCDHCVYYKKQ